MDLRDQLQSALQDTYTFERELAAGGMSRVFVADEIALGRKVVVKVLPSEMSGQVSIGRFQREIRLAAALQQANIVPVLSAGDAGGVAYYTMPFVQGESLRALISSRGALPVAECVAILRDVARALAYAHGEGIVHRDIKPENILLSGGTAVVTDFGIAKAVAASHAQPRGATLTQTGLALGTPMYMAPEQALGESTVDHRADLYSYGIVAYELLTGTPPFAGRTAQALVAAHVAERPTPLRERRTEVPDALAQLVMRCLQKDPAARPGAASEILDALDRLSTPAAATAAPGLSSKPSIAVLPFANLSPNPADEYFADGLTDEIITDLSPIRSLRVIARTTMMRYKKSGKDPLVVARELGVRYVLDGSVRRAGNSLRLTALLLDATDGSTMWSDKLGGTLEDVFTMQERVSRTIVDALQVTLSPHEAQQLEARPIKDLVAYESYLQARQSMWGFTVASLDRAYQLLLAAQARVGDNARLLAALGTVHLNYVDTGQVDVARHLTAAEECAKKLAALDPDAASLHAMRAALHFRRGEMREAMASYARSREMEPNNADTAMMLCYACELSGKDAEGRALAASTIELDPLTPLVQCMPGFCELMAGRAAAAVPHYRKFLTMDPGNPAAHFFLAWVLSEAGETTEAMSAGDRVALLFPGTFFAQLGKACAHAMRGQAREGAAAITDDVRLLSRNSEMFARASGCILARLGETEAAIDALEDAVRLGLAHYPYLSRDAPSLAPLRDVPRFRRLLDVVRGRWERGGTSGADLAAARA
ncbi:MAG: protein kinase [Gemmatimonadales bacterium]